MPEASPAPHDLPDTTPTEVCEVVVNLDDATGEVIGDAAEALLAAGALDVWTTAIMMKKGRPGVMLSVLCPEADREPTARRVLRLTGGFGVRYRTWDRTVLDRRFAEVDTPLGPVTVKVGSLDGATVAVQPEFKSVRQLAGASGVTVREAMQHADAAAAEMQRGGG